MRVHTFVSVTTHDSPGALGEIATALAAHHVNIDGFSVERGNVRFLTDQPTEAHEALIANGHSPSVMDVVEVRLPNRPGALGRLGTALGEADVNIVSTFGLTHGGSGRVFLRLSDIERARPVLLRMQGKPAPASG